MHAWWSPWERYTGLETQPGFALTKDTSMINEHQVSAMSVGREATIYGTSVLYGRPVLRKVGTYDQVQLWLNQIACLVMGAALYTLHNPRTLVSREDANKVGAWKDEGLNIASVSELFDLASTPFQEKAIDVGYLVGCGCYPTGVDAQSGMKHIRTATLRFGVLLHRYMHGTIFECRDSVTTSLIRRTEAAIKMAKAMAFSIYREDELRSFLDVIGSHTSLQLVFDIETSD